MLQTGAREMLKATLIAAGLVVVGPILAQAQSRTSPEGAAAYIIWPYDGQTIDGDKLWVRMGLKGMGVAPAGVDKENTGHHHLLVDVELPPLDEPIPNDRSHIHFGGGQTEARLEGLSPGKHTLQMILADDKHIPFDPPVISKVITITVRP
jgi:hypothetical protein